MPDEQTIALVALAVAVVGVVATFAAPRFTQSARVWFDIVDVVQIQGFSSPAEDLAIVIQHKGITIDRPVFIVRAVAENTGSLDLISAHFAEPVEISLPASLEILAASCTAGEGVRPELLHTSCTASLKWTLLKPKEKINLALIVAAPNASYDAQRVRREAARVVRLIDVRTGKGFWAARPGLTGALIGALLSFAIGCSAVAYRVISVERNIAVAHTELGSEALFIGFEGELRACELPDPPELLSTCRDLTRTQANALLAQATVEDVSMGYSRRRLRYVALLVFLGAFLGFTAARGFQGVVRTLENLSLRRGDP